MEEKTPEKIEWEGITFSPIEDLRFDKGTFYAEDGNPYGLEVGEKAGVFVKDAVEINEKMESSIGLRPEVIEVLQKKIMEEDKEFKYPFPIDLEQAKVNLEQTEGIKIKEAEFQEAEQTPEENRIFDKDTFLAISNVPLGTIIYCPSSTLMFGNKDIFGFYGGMHRFRFNIIPSLFEEEIINNHRLDRCGILIEYDPKGAEFISKEIEKQFLKQQKIWESDPTIQPDEIETKMETPLFKIIDEVNLKEAVYEERPEEEDPIYRWLYVGLRETDYQIRIYYGPFSGNLENYKGGTTGLRNLMEVGEMKVFILPAYD